MTVRFPERPKISSIEDDCIYYSFNHMTVVATEGKSAGELWRLRGIAVDSNTGQIYVTEWFPRVTIFSETLEFLKTFTHENMKGPWGIVIHNDSMYMTDSIRHSVFKFKVRGDSPVFINEQGRKGSSIEHYDMPGLLAVSINGDVHVSDYYNHRIKVLDRNLHYLRRISHRSMKRPRDVKLTPDEVYVLSDSDAYCIHVFSHAGKKIQSLIPCGYGPEAQVKYPYFFCLDLRGNFVISDCSLCQIKIFSKEGDLIHTLDSQELQLGGYCFYLPCGGAQTINGKLLVTSQMGEKSLRMFSW